MGSAPDLTNARRVLIVKLSALGDIVHALPVAAALRERFPHLEIDWVAEAPCSDILQGSPVLRTVHSIVRRKRAERFRPAAITDFRELARRLRRERYDVALDLQGLTKSAVIAASSGASVRLGYDWLREAAPYLVRRVRRRPESLHIVDQLLDVARHLGARPESVRFPLHIAPEEEEAAASLLASAGVAADAPYLVVNPTDGGGGGYKGLPPAKLADVLDRVTDRTGLPWVMVGGPGDRALAEETRARARALVADLVGRTSLKHLAAVIRGARLHLSGDTGSSHVAVAVGTPPVAVFSRSNPERVGPYGYARNVVHARHRCCERCRRMHDTAPINSTSKCLGPPPACLEAVTADAVVAAALQALAAGGEA
ncbi:MAG TPA: glycosyltransferase family 9 protein [Chthonomonadales bacterium]|nr:glycosyltransferase family 9 protein [Chthonomonadales bacterium]